MSSDVVVFRPGFGRGLSVAVWLGCAFVLVSGLVQSPGTAWRWVPLVALVALVVWAAYWNPAVVVTPAGVELRNVLRTVELPWPAITLVDVQYALTLETAWGSYSAWAAPAPSRARARTSGPSDMAHLPESSYSAGGTVRPGDLLSSDSGQAAALVRSRWEEVRDAGLLDDPRVERSRPVVRVHVALVAGVLFLAALSVLTLAL
ncbi:PH domain-containing protein [Cellulomonas sp. URHB0016]